MFFRTVPSANTLVRWVNEIAFASIVQARPSPPLADRFIFGAAPIDYGPVLLLKPFGFHLAMDTLLSGDCLLRPTTHYRRERRKGTNQLALWDDEPAPAFWQRRYYDFNVFRERKHIEELRYIHRNPVKRGLVRSPELWRWSSFRYYWLGEKGPVKIGDRQTHPLQAKG